MTKQFKVLVNVGKDKNAQTHAAEQGAGERGRPLVLKAQAGAKYQLVEVSKPDNRAPDNIKAKRVGKNLHLMFETDEQADVIIEDYYSVIGDDYNAIVGRAENGRFYEYLTEDPTDNGLIPLLGDSGTAVTQALGGAEVAHYGAVVAAAGINPLWGALGLLGLGGGSAGAAAPAAALKASGALHSDSDSGVQGDHLTKDNTPALSGQVTAGASATVSLNGKTYPASVDANGNWFAQIPDTDKLPDGTYYPVLNATLNGVTTQFDITPFTIDTTPPAVAITSNASVLAPNAVATVTFTLSEASADFGRDDIEVTGGVLGPLVQSATNPLVYTATYTHANSGPNATIRIASDRFADAAANRNSDGGEANNTLVMANISGALTPVGPSDSGALGDNLTQDNTPQLSGKVPVGATATITLNGKTYPTTIDANGNWTAQVPGTDQLPDGT